MRRDWRWRTVIPAGMLMLAGCAIETVPSGGGRGPATPTAQRPTPTQTTQRADPQDVERLSRLMIPLLKAANHPRSLDQVKVGIVPDDSINAGSAGSGQFIITRGLLNRANDERLQAVLAHEVAHDDLGHVAKQQALGTGLGLGVAILDQIFPGTGQIAPIAGQLIMLRYSRNEEFEADRHGVELLRRVGSSKDAMERTLVWLKEQTGGGSKGGFFATHPGTDDRIAAIRRMP
ncbi:MAG TPA: M48 family metallopeptidase [Methylomirabilota bacterium]|jgi:Zn-dependent protease with chaperone function|nr:M48 family metallopeptidase [Methylomirabilota bacterium]